MQSNLSFCLIIVLFGCFAAVTSLSCIGDDGSAVDWFIAYKLPKSVDKTLDGYGYYYMDEKSNGFQLSKSTVRVTTSAMGATLKPVYDNVKTKTQDMTYIFYNDETPDEPPSIRRNILFEWFLLGNRRADRRWFVRNIKTIRKWINGLTIFQLIKMQEWLKRLKRIGSLRQYLWYMRRRLLPDIGSRELGHSKGAVAFTAISGFWMIHSVPKYPSFTKAGYIYPPSGAKYGQMFLCVSFDASKFDLIGRQLRFIRPKIHDYYLPQAMVQRFPNVKALLKGEFIDDPTNSKVNLDSTVHFAKNDLFGQDLYHNFVAPTLKSNLLAETWIRGHAIGPSCDGYTVEDITMIKIGNKYMFKSTTDHSKFAISKPGSPQEHYVCIGDINRMTSQYNRGGGTMCVSSAYIWNHFNLLVRGVDRCP